MCNTVITIINDYRLIYSLLVPETKKCASEYFSALKDLKTKEIRPLDSNSVTLSISDVIYEILQY